MITYKRHSTALKLQLVHAYMNGEGSCKQLAARHNINYALLILWVQKFQRGEITEEQDQPETVAEYEAKIAALERKVGQLTMELDFLKKTDKLAARSKSEPPSITAGRKGLAPVFPLRRDVKS